MNQPFPLPLCTMPTSCSHVKCAFFSLPREVVQIQLPLSAPITKPLTATASKSLRCKADRNGT